MSSELDTTPFMPDDLISIELMPDETKVHAEQN